MALYLPKKDSPCNFCKDERHIGCHANCEKFKRFEYFNRKRNEMARKKEIIENGLNEADILRNTRNRRI